MRKHHSVPGDHVTAVLHGGISVRDMGAMKTSLLENGVDIAHEVSMNGDRVLFIRDPSGVLIELIQP